MKKWVLRKYNGDTEKMSEVLGISPILAQVLLNRGINSKMDADKYLRISENDFNDISQMKHMDNAIEFIIQSIKDNKRILLYGDYDVDGVTSTTIMYKTLKSINADVEYYIPDREREGYGLNRKAIEGFKGRVDVLITLDNGIASLEENKLIMDLGMKLVVIDHHEVPLNDDIEVGVVGDFVIDAKQSACNYPFKQMCTAGLAFRFSKRIYEKLEMDFLIENEAYIFAMIGTICDIVDLKEDNRIIVKKGMELINSNNTNEGLMELMRGKSIFGKKIDVFHIGFVIGPCINASGRLKRASLAVDLFTSDNPEEIEELARELISLNEERKMLTEEATARAIEQVENSDIKNDKVFVLYDRQIHESIAGIVAGRIKDKYYHPTIVLTKGEEYVKGSARSIPVYDIFQGLSQVKKYFERFGGHAMAAGLSLKEENLDSFKKELNENATLTEEDFQEIIALDEKLELDQITYELYREISTLKPFGKDNKQPLFGTVKAEVNDIRIIEDKNTIIFTFKINDHRNIKGISFGQVSDFYEAISLKFSPYVQNKIKNGMVRNVDLALDIVYYIEVNEFRGDISLQLKIGDFKLA